MVSGSLSLFGADRYFLKPFFSGRSVVRIVFLPCSGLGLLETLVAGTGRLGTLLDDDWLRESGDAASLFSILSLDRLVRMEGRGGSAGVGAGSSDICMGLIVSSPSHDDPDDLSGVGVMSWPPLDFPNRLLPESDFLSSGESLGIS